MKTDDHSMETRRKRLQTRIPLQKHNRSSIQLTKKKIRQLPKKHKKMLSTKRNNYKSTMLQPKRILVQLASKTTRNQQMETLHLQNLFSIKKKFPKAKIKGKNNRGTIARNISNFKKTK